MLIVLYRVCCVKSVSRNNYEQEYRAPVALSLQYTAPPLTNGRVVLISPSSVLSVYLSSSSTSGARRRRRKAVRTLRAAK